MDAQSRNAVRQRALHCCEYCRLPDDADPYSVFHVDHILARQHGGVEDLANLAWACSRCNRRKGTNAVSSDPDTGALVELYNPRQHAWADHFSVAQARIVGVTPTGRATARLLDMNDSRRVRLRRELINQRRFRTV